ncbi:MAG: hypothetical protein CMC97_04780, partial [Flavobacteriales bacterium]|nr:hypothetical protein [Flavobacteriales bacterium]
MCFSQEVDHWEAVLQDGTQWRYWLPNSQPANDWMEGGFSDAAWPEGPAGFGYGDGDDNTVLPSTPAVYLRHTFEIDDLNQWLDAHFYMDYDDGFVAYLNGTEIGRGNAGQPGDFIAWNQGLDMDQEAVLYAGGTPSSFPFDLSLLTEGPNTLAIEIHNVSPTSSDLTARPFLFAGVPEAGLGHGPPPTWFSPPGADMHPVTFEVNMTNETVSTDGVYVAGGGYFGVPGDNPMTDADGDGTWTATIEVPHGFTGYYTFVNGNCAD